MRPEDLAGGVPGQAGAPMFERLGTLAYRFRFVVVAARIGLAGGAMLFAP